MNKKFLISVFLMFVMSMAIGYFVHEPLLGQDYARVSGLFRPKQEQMNYFPYLLARACFLATAFVWIYLKRKEDKPFVMQGFRYGIAIAVLMTIPTFGYQCSLPRRRRSIIDSHQVRVWKPTGLKLRRITPAWSGQQERLRFFRSVAGAAADAKR